MESIIAIPCTPESATKRDFPRGKKRNLEAERYRVDSAVDFDLVTYRLGICSTSTVRAN